MTGFAQPNSVLAFLVNPLLLGLGAALVSVPIIIHLLNRRRVRRIEWAAMDWLLAALKRHQRRLRLENWLILALRCLAILLLALALARPVVTDSDFAQIFGERQSVYVVLDTSYSTAAKTDARSVFERAKREAELVIGGLDKADSLAVVVTNNPDEDNYDGMLPSVLIPRTLGAEGAARAKEAIAALQPRHAPAHWTDTLILVQEQIQAEDANRKVVIITDLQAKDWLRPDRTQVDGTPAADAGRDRLTETLLSILRQRSTSVTVVDVGGADRRNLAVTGVANRTERGSFVGRPLHLEVQVTNFGQQAVTGAVLEVAVDGRAARKVELPPLEAVGGGTRVPTPAVAKVQVSLPRTTFEEPGSHEVRIKIGPPSTDPAADGLGLDSERWFTVSVRRRIQVLAYTNDSDLATRPGGFRLKASQYLAGVYEGDEPGAGADMLGLGSLYTFDHVPLAPQLLERLRNRRNNPVDLVVLANAPIRDPNLVSALRSFVREGGALMVFTGDRFTTPEMFNEAFYGDVPDERLAPFKLAAAEVRPLSQDPFRFNLDEQARPHPIATLFTGKPADVWLRQMPPRIFGRTPFVETDPGPLPGTEGPEAPDGPPGEVVLRFEDGKPAVVAGELGEGRTLWVGTTVDGVWTELFENMFLPVFLEEGALWLTEPHDDGRNLVVGDRISLRLPPGAEEPRFSVPGGMQMAPTRRVDAASGSGQSTVTYDTVGVAGVWKLSYHVPDPSGATRKVVEMIAVNPDADEGSLLPADTDAISRPLPPELRIEFKTGYGEAGEEIRKVREGEITPYVIWALLAILLIESFLAMRFGRRGNTEGNEA